MTNRSTVRGHLALLLALLLPTIASAQGGGGGGGGKAAGGFSGGVPEAPRMVQGDVSGPQS